MCQDVFNIHCNMYIHHTAWEGRYCQLDVDGCMEYACIEGVECVDVPAPGEGAVCEGCPVGYTADGDKCRGI